MKIHRLKTRILLAFFAIILVLGVSIFALGFYLIKEDIYARAKRQVGHYLESARTVYSSEIERIGSALELVDLNSDLAVLQQKISLDYLYRVDVEAGTSGPSEIVRSCIERGKAVGGTRIAGGDEIARMSPEVQTRCRIAIQETAKARPSSMRELDSAMVKEYAVPLHNAEGGIVGVVYGGRVANQDY